MYSKVRKKQGAGLCVWYERRHSCAKTISERCQKLLIVITPGTWNWMEGTGKFPFHFISFCAVRIFYSVNVDKRHGKV